MNLCALRLAGPPMMKSTHRSASHGMPTIRKKMYQMPRSARMKWSPFHAVSMTTKSRNHQATATRSHHAMRGNMARAMSISTPWK